MSDDQFMVACARSTDLTAATKSIFCHGGTGVGFIELDFAPTTNYPRAIWKDDASAQTTNSDVQAYTGPCVISGRKVGNVKVLRVNGLQKATDSTVMGATNVSAAVIGARYVTSAINTKHRGPIFGVIAGKGTITDSEILVLERWLGQLGGVVI
jgi:hypothetical protein